MVCERCSQCRWGGARVEMSGVGLGGIVHAYLPLHPHRPAPPCLASTVTVACHGVISSLRLAHRSSWPPRPPRAV